MEDAEGSLLVTCQLVPINNDLRHPDQDIQQNPVQYESTPGIPVIEQETPMDLSVVKIEMKEEELTRDSHDRDSGYTSISSPPLVDLTNIPDEDPTQMVSSECKETFINCFIRLQLSRRSPTTY